MDLGEAASYAAYGAAVTLILAGVAFALFLRGGVTSVWGPINDVFTAVTALLLIPPMLAVLDLASNGAQTWFALVTWTAVAGATLVAVGQLLLVAGRLSLQGSFVTGGLGFVPVVAWMAAHAILAIEGGLALDPIVGWLAIGLLASAGLLAASVRVSTLVASVVAVGVLGLGVAWLVALGISLAAQ